jgi:hypothetical protein
VALSVVRLGSGIGFPSSFNFDVSGVPRKMENTAGTPCDPKG